MHHYSCIYNLSLILHVLISGNEKVRRGFLTKKDLDVGEERVSEYNKVWFGGGLLSFMRILYYIPSIKCSLRNFIIHFSYGANQLKYLVICIIQRCKPEDTELDAPYFSAVLFCSWFWGEKGKQPFKTFSDISLEDSEQPLHQDRHSPLQRLNIQNISVTSTEGSILHPFVGSLFFILDISGAAWQD